MARHKNGTIARYQKARGLQANRFKFVKQENFDAAMDLFNSVSTGFDIAKSNTKTGTKTKQVHKVKPRTLAHGWYVDIISGIQHKCPKSFEPIIQTSGRVTVNKQKPVKQDAILSRVNHQMLLNGIYLADIATITDQQVDTFLTTASWKVMWTNLSNVKLCYEYYYVTPKGDKGNNFQTDLVALTGLLDTSGNHNSVFTNWKPSDTPELLRNWTILGKSVFRLAPGETGELHCKDRIYKKFGDAEQTTGRNYKAGVAGQLYVRWYGCPTGTALPAAPTLVVDAMFGDHLLATSWIVETKYNYYKADSVNVKRAQWDTDVLSAPSAGTVVVTHADSTEDLITAE